MTYFRTIRNRYFIGFLLLRPKGTLKTCTTFAKTRTTEILTTYMKSINLILSINIYCYNQWSSNAYLWYNALKSTIYIQNHCQRSRPLLAWYMNASDIASPFRRSQSSGTRIPSWSIRRSLHEKIADNNSYELQSVKRDSCQSSEDVTPKYRPALFIT